MDFRRSVIDYFPKFCDSAQRHNRPGWWRSLLRANKARACRGLRIAAFAATPWCVFTAAASAQPYQKAVSDAVVIVDTSTSMRQTGMDPERASLLVTKLLADIVPGDLAVVRLLDVSTDRNLLPSHETGESVQCQEDPTQQCRKVQPDTDWLAEARQKMFGALVRPARGDAGYKQALEQHLVQRVNNSMFGLAFSAAHGIFDTHHKDSQHPADVPRTVVWISDGRSEEPEMVRHEIGDLTAGGVAVEAVVFGQGDIRLAQDAGLTPRRVSTPAEIMKAFAAAFRRIVEAPYDIDNVVSTQPAFDMKPNVDEAWIVVYGDDSLGDVSLDGPSGTIRADYASDRWLGAGAYKVAYLEHPPAGRWTVHASGGGAGVAYAVVQRSALTPVLLEPRRALSGAQVSLVGAVRAGRTGELIRDPELLRDLVMTAEFQGQTVTLQDRGTPPDTVASDGRFAASVMFHGSGRVPVRMRIRSPLVDRWSDAAVDVSGRFRYTGGPIDVDLGVLGVNAESCRPLRFSSDFQGEVPFELRALRSLPSGHTLSVKLPTGRLAAGKGQVIAKAGDPFEVCLATSKLAPSSSASGEPWLELHVAGSDAAEHKVPVRLRWRVNGLSFWQRWRWLILLILGILLLLFIICGFILPARFQSGLAVVYVPERDELDEQSPQPVKQWRGVGIGFYRDARAYLHADFRLSGNPQGALASLHAEKGGTRAMPGRGLTLFRETLEADWEGVVPGGRRARAGDVYRIGERGPYFRIATRGRT